MGGYKLYLGSGGGKEWYKSYSAADFAILQVNLRYRCQRNSTLLSMLMQLLLQDVGYSTPQNILLSQDDYVLITSLHLNAKLY